MIFDKNKLTTNQTGNLTAYEYPSVYDDKMIHIVVIKPTPEETIGKIIQMALDTEFAGNIVIADKVKVSDSFGIWDAEYVAEYTMRNAMRHYPDKLKEMQNESATCNLCRCRNNMYTYHDKRHGIVINQMIDKATERSLEKFKKEAQVLSRTYASHQFKGTITLDGKYATIVFADKTSHVVLVDQIRNVMRTHVTRQNAILESEKAKKRREEIHAQNQV